MNKTIKARFREGEQRERARRKKRLLTITGALIIFVTFMVKEAIRDYVRDLRDSLESAENIYTLEQQIGNVEMYSTLSNEVTMVTSVKQTLAETPAPSKAEYPTEITRTLMIIHERDAALQGEGQRMARLVDRMPISKTQLTDTMTKLTAMLSDLNKTVETKTKEIKGKPQDGNTLALAQGNLAFLLVMEADIFLLGSVILEAARKEEEALETAYNRYTVASIFLFAIGWGVGLYGALSGIGIPE
jgi:hypothetical protein